MHNKKTLTRLLTIHQTILQSDWIEEVMKAHYIQPFDLVVLREERQKSPSILETHHMIYRELGGSSKQRNEVSLPHYIHHRIHQQFPDMLPHQMIYTMMISDTHKQSQEDIYLPHILPDLGIAPPDELNPIVAKYLQNLS